VSEEENDSTTASLTRSANRIRPFPEDPGTAEVRKPPAPDYGAGTLVVTGPTSTESGLKQPVTESTVET